MTDSTTRTLADDLIAAGVRHATAATLAKLHPNHREDAERLAAARQEISAEGAWRTPQWHELTPEGRATATVEAWHYLRAAERAGLDRRCDCRTAR